MRTGAIPVEIRAKLLFIQLAGSAIMPVILTSVVFSRGENARTYR